MRRLRKFFRTILKQRVTFPGGKGYLMGATLTTLQKTIPKAEDNEKKVTYLPELFFIIEPIGKHEHGYLLIRSAKECELLG